MRLVSNHGIRVYSEGPFDECAEEYKKFQRCLPQLIDSDSMLGDLDGKWVIFKDGWVYGLATYEHEASAVQFARHMLEDDQGSAWVIAQVSLADHSISPLHLLADALSDLEFDQDI